MRASWPSDRRADGSDGGLDAGRQGQEAPKGKQALEMTISERISHHEITNPSQTS